MMRSLGRALEAPARWWRRSLSFRLVSSAVAASLAILLITGVVLVGRSTQGILEAKTQQSVSEASAVLDSLQGALTQPDLQASNVNERLQVLARDAAVRGSVANQYEIVISGPVSDFLSSGVDVDSVPESIRASVRNGPNDVYTTPTLIRYTDGRAAQPGLVVASNLVAPGLGRFPVYFLFSMEREQETLDVIREASLSAGTAFLPVMAGIMYLISLQVLRPVRAARLAAGRLAAGHLDERMPVHGTEDMAGLARSLNYMGGELSRKIGELEELSAVQRQFVSDVSHELRTPLTTVRMAAEMIYDDRASFEPATRRSAELLDRELDRFESLLTELLEISRFDSGAAELTLEEVDLVELAQAEAQAQKPLAEKYHTEISVDAPEPCVCQIDPRRIRRIVANLLSNAIEHGEGRPITVYVRGDANAVAVAVRDHGVGFSADQAHQVFTRFWRADPSRTRTVGGSGLGLSIAMEDAQLHGGWLNAWGMPGQGAQFRLTLPRTAGGTLASSPWPVVPPDREGVR